MNTSPFSDPNRCTSVMVKHLPGCAVKQIRVAVGTAEGHLAVYPSVEEAKKLAQEILDAAALYERL